MRLDPKAAGLVAVVATAAVAVSTVVVARQVPTLNAGDQPVAPLGAATTGTPTPSRTAVSTPPLTSAKPSSSTPSVPGLTGPAQVVIDPGTLDRGAAPAVPYVDERMLVSGGYQATTKSPIIAGARAGNGLMAIVALTDLYTELQVFAANGRLLRSVKDIGTLRSSPDGAFTAYASERFTSNGDKVKGSTLSWVDNAAAKTRQLKRPGDYEVRILMVDEYRVYFRSKASPDGDPALYRWEAATDGKVERVTGVTSPTAVDRAGSQVAMLSSITDNGSCTKVVASFDIKTEYWKTCDFQVGEFGPRGRTVLASDAYGDGYAPTYAAVLDNSNGKLLRKWSGVSVMQTAYEDEDHVLLVTEKGSRGAIVRCAISTGKCELATPYVEGIGAQAPGNPYRLG